MTTMRAVRLKYDSLDLAIHEVEIPEPQRGEVRIKVGAVGVCLSDVKLVSGVLTPPMGTRGTVTLGHEIAGVVDKVGAEAGSWTVGDRVLVHPLVQHTSGPLVIGMDLDGGWADYVTVGASNLIRVPDGLPLSQAAIIPDAVSTPWAAVTSTAQVQAGQSAAVWGVGGLGLHAVKALRIVGSTPIIAIDPMAEARERALSAGADFALDPTEANLVEQLREAAGGSGVDHAFDVVGAPGVREQALESLGHGGQLTIVGAGGKPFTVTNPQRLIVFKQRIAGHFSSSFEDLQTITNLIAGGRLDLSTSVSEVLPLEKAAEALDRLQTKKNSPTRIVLSPDLDVAQSV